MATKEEREELEIALAEVEPITPWFDEECDCWVFSHPSYPVEYGGDSPQAVKKNYPKYLLEFIHHRLKGNLNPDVEKRTKGRGGYRPGSGRPKDTKKEPKRRVYLPVELADWLADYSHLEIVRKMMLKDKSKAS